MPAPRPDPGPGAGARRGFPLARIGGIAVRADASWLVVVALVTWSFWDRFDHDPRFGGSAAFIMALAAAVLFFVSVLAHELAHALEGRFRGVPIGGITLFLFGGMTEMRVEARRPIDEFAMTAVGPFTSLTIGCLFGLLANAADHRGLAELAQVFGVVGWLNVGLTVFNLLPGAPLDGGRILRAIAWKVTGNRHLAVRIAAGAGQVLGGLLIAIGLFEVFFVPAAFVNGLWLAFLGWVLTLDDVRRVPPEARGRVLVQDVMRSVDDLPWLEADTPASAVLDQLEADGVAVVFDDAEPLGLVTLPDVLTRLRRDEELGRAPAVAA
jgi:Zn-dependent protease